MLKIIICFVLSLAVSCQVPKEKKRSVNVPKKDTMRSYLTYLDFDIFTLKPIGNPAKRSINTRCLEFFDKGDSIVLHLYDPGMVIPNKRVYTKKQGYIFSKKYVNSDGFIYISNEYIKPNVVISFKYEASSGHKYYRQDDYSYLSENLQCASMYGVRILKDMKIYGLGANSEKPFIESPDFDVVNQNFWKYAGEIHFNRIKGDSVVVRKKNVTKYETLMRYYYSISDFSFFWDYYLRADRI